MATAPQTVCRTPCCPGYAVERGYCEPCAKLNPKKKDDNRRHKIALQRSKEEIAFYQTSEWRYTTQPTAIAYNAQCQFLVNGVQCLQPSKFVHHKVSPRVDIGKGHDPRNLVCLCQEHHPPTSGDDPKNPRPYVPTRWRHGPGLPIAEYKHEQPLQPGRVPAQGTQVDDMDLSIPDFDFTKPPER